MPRICRVQASAIFYFRGTHSEDEAMCEDYCPPKYNKKEFMGILNHATRIPYSFLFINNHVGFRTRYRECLHTILTLDRFEEEIKKDDNPKGIDEEEEDNEGEEGDEGDEGDEEEEEK